MNNANNSGDNGHLCLEPLCKQKGFDVCPLVITEAVGALYK